MFWRSHGDLLYSYFHVIHLPGMRKIVGFCGGKAFHISIMGEAALTSHAKGSKHQWFGFLIVSLNTTFDHFFMYTPEVSQNV